MNILDTLGNTPNIIPHKINKICQSNLLLKLEKCNPAGSIKDRPALYLINHAEAEGWLKPGGTIIESSSGNFGISLAMIGAVRGYKVIIIVDPKTTASNLALMKAYGAEVIVVTEKDDTGSYHKTRISLANQLAHEIENSYRPDQCFNYLSCLAHQATTAEEIYQQTHGQLSGVIAAVSTGGQIGGISEYFSKKAPHIKIGCVDVHGSSIFGGPSHAYKTPGVGLGWTPNNIKNVNLIHYIFRVTDEAAYITTRILCRNEGILVGVSSGAVLLAAIAFSKLNLENNQPDPVLAVLGDSGERYQGTLFNEQWLNDNHIPLQTDLECLPELVASVCLEQQSPQITANYQPELAESLNIPATTMAQPIA